MSYVNMKEMLRKARAGGYAVGAFNIVDLVSAQAVVEAASQAESPVIVQTSAKTVVQYGARVLADIVKAIASKHTVPVALHVDHCKDVELIRECIESGFSSVMFDGSSLSFEENVETTRQVVQTAHAKGLTVEGEIGAIVGVEDDIFVKKEESHLADPAQAVEFVEKTGVDILAPAIGTAHGIYKGEPHIDFDRLAKISQDTGIPIAIHGGTGLSDEVFRRCIELGGAKINVSTQLKHVFRDSLEEFYGKNPGEYEPLHAIRHLGESINKMVTDFLARFGSVGKASGGNA